MNSQGFVESRNIRSIEINSDVVVIGGGLTGVCCAMSAARLGAKVVLVQDRPVLGGNASSEVRLWALGATSHMGNNNRWSREGGVIDEIMTENVYRNREGNPVIFDTVLLDMVMHQPGITLLLNTVVHSVGKRDDHTVSYVIAHNAINETSYRITGKYFADCSGDGLVSYLAGSPYRMGSEAREDYDEGFAPDRDLYGELLGHTILFYMKDTGKPVNYVAPQFALKDVERHISKIHNDQYFSIHHHGCKYWWIEYGGRLDTIHDSEDIKNELWKVVYGIWDYIKNSGKFPEMANYTLEWVGTIPGKRESRRMVGLYTLTQRDIIEQHTHYDAVAYGGWAIDLHPSNGVYASGKACNQWHSKGVYQIPYRCYLGNHIRNLMFGGRIISTTHVANGSTRVMCTSACGGQAIGTALALCKRYDCMPADFVDPDRIKVLQRELLAQGQYIPGLELNDDSNLLNCADLKVSSEYLFDGFRPNGTYAPLKFSTAALFPVEAGRVPAISLKVKALEDTVLTVELRHAIRENGFTPDGLMEKRDFELKEGLNEIKIEFETEIPNRQYIFVCFMANDKVMMPQSDDLITGTTTVLNQINLAVSNYGRQDPPAGIGIESFEFWCPLRRPEGKNIAFRVSPALHIFSPDFLKRGVMRPVGGTNAWAASNEDSDPSLTLSWPTEKTLSELKLFFDTDFDHAMETVQMGHSESVMPYCVRDYVVTDGEGKVLAKVEGNYKSVNHLKFDPPVVTGKLSIHLRRPSAQVPATLFHVMVK